jgi:hypothetical protein
VEDYFLILKETLVGLNVDEKNMIEEFENSSK